MEYIDPLINTNQWWLADMTIYVGLLSKLVFGIDWSFNSHKSIMITIVDITIYVGLLSKHEVKMRRHWQSFFSPILSQSMKTHTKRLISSLLGQTSTRNQFFCFLFFQFLNISISWNPSTWISLFLSFILSGAELANWDCWIC